MLLPNPFLLAMVGGIAHAELVTLHVRALPMSSRASLVEQSSTLFSDQNLISSTQTISVRTLIPPAVLLASTTASSSASSAVASPAIPPCGGKCFPDGFQDCAMKDALNDFACVCTKQLHYLYRFLNGLAPCVANNTGCTESEWSEYMYGLEKACANTENAITTLPPMISTWIKYTVSFTVSATASSTGTISTFITSTPSASSNTSHTSLTPPIDPKANKGTKIGVGVGVAAIAVLGIGGAAAWWLRKRRRQTGAKTNEKGNNEVLPIVEESKARLEHTAVASELGDREMAEMWSPPSELGTTSMVSELPGDSEYLQASSKPEAKMSKVSELDGDSGTRDAEK